MLPTVAFTPSISAASMPMLHLLPPAPGRFTASAADQAEWLAFRNRFIAPEGRVVDTGNGGVSHSEGQGYAMLSPNGPTTGRVSMPAAVDARQSVASL